MPNDLAKNVKSTSFEISFPTLPNRKLKPSEATLRQKAGQHDILTLEFPFQVPAWLATLKTGIPIEFKWTQGLRTSVWHGYVSLSSYEQAPQKYRPTKIQCIGASYVLKQAVCRVFKNKTVREVAAIVAAENGLSFIGDKLPNLTRYNQLTITGESYWEWLQMHAEEIGCVMFVSGTRLYLRKAQEVLDVGSTDIPILQMWSNDIPVTNVGPDRTLYTFKMLNGEYVEQASNTRTSKTISGVNALTGKIFTTKATQKDVGKGLRRVTSDVLFDDQLTASVSQSLEAAKSKTQGAALLSQFSLPAKAVAQGDPRIRLYYPVFVDGTGSASDGDWMVSGVTHAFHANGEYKASLDLLTDGSGPSLVTLYRSASPNRQGLVNLKKAIADNTPNIGASGAGKTALRTNSKIIKESNQGFSRTPTRWKATAQSKSEGRR